MEQAKVYSIWEAHLYEQQNTDPEVLIEQWLSVKKSNTKRVYQRVAKRWFDFLQDNNLGLLNINRLHLQLYISRREKEQGAKPRYAGESLIAGSTLATEIGAIMSMYRMLDQNKVIDNPLEGFKFTGEKKNRKRTTEIITDDQFHRLLALPDHETKIGLRDKAILSILFAGALRRNEVIKLRVGDVRETNTGAVYVRLRDTKNNTDVDQAIAPFAWSVILQYKTARVFEGAKDNDFLFVQYYKTKKFAIRSDYFDQKTFYCLVKRYCIQAKLKNITPHSARATTLTKMIETGEADRDIMDFSRHSSPSMLRVYDHRLKNVSTSVAMRLDFSKPNNSIQ